LLLSVLHYLDAEQIEYTCQVGHFLNRILKQHDESLFRPQVLRHPLVSQPIPVTLEQKLAANHTLEEALTPRNGWKGLYHLTNRLLGVPCLGFFRRVPDKFGSGQLLRVRPRGEGHL